MTICSVKSGETEAIMKKKESVFRVAHIIGKYVGGGVEQFVLNYYQWIDKNKIQFDFICDEDSTSIPYDIIQCLGGRVILIPPYQNIVKYQKQLRIILEENKYLIVHSHINTLSILPLYVAQKAKVPIRIAHSHATSSNKEIKRNFIKMFLRPYSKVFSTHYVACSDVAGKWLFGKKTFEQKGMVINNAIDLEKFKYNEDIRKEKRKELNISDSTIVIGNVGRIVETKNQNFLIDVFEKLIKKTQGNYILMIIGRGPLENDLKNKVKDYGLENRVFFCGQKEDVYNYYQIFDIFALPSFYEGFGMSLLEAQVSNLPCLISDSVPESAIFNENVKKKSLNCNIDDWIDSLVMMSNNKTRHNQVKRIQENGFDIKNEVKKLENYYLSLIENERKSKIIKRKT